MDKQSPNQVLEHIIQEAVFRELKEKGYDEALIQSMLKDHRDTAALLREVFPQLPSKKD